MEIVEIVDMIQVLFSPRADLAPSANSGNGMSTVSERAHLAPSGNSGNRVMYNIGRSIIGNN